MQQQKNLKKPHGSTLQTEGRDFHKRVPQKPLNTTTVLTKSQKNPS